MLTNVEFNLFLPSEELIKKWEETDYDPSFNMSESTVSNQEFKEIDGVYYGDLNANLWFEESNLHVIDLHQAESIVYKMQGGNYQDILRIRKELFGFEKECYGVCDNYKQVLEHYPELATSSKKYFIVLTPISKEYEPPRDGWRWCKWGDYIGTQNPQCEYLYDEPEIKEVYVYKIYTLQEEHAQLK